MKQINWNKFKIYKLERSSVANMDNFQILIEFIRGFYNIVHIEDIFDILQNDELSAQMLDKREIKNAIELDDYLYRLQQSIRE